MNNKSEITMNSPTMAGKIISWLFGIAVFAEPAPKDHPWRTMPNHGMTPHISGSSLSAQARYASGVREILECWFQGKGLRSEYLIVAGGKLAGVGAHSYSAGNAISGYEEAVKFNTNK